MSSDRSDAGIRLLGYSAARRRNLQVDEAARPRRVGPRPDGLLPRTLPAVVNSRRVLPVQRGEYAPEWDPHYDTDPQERWGGSSQHRPLIDDLSTEEMAREAVASLRQHHASQPQPDLAPELLDLDAGESPNRADRRVPSGRHRGQPTSLKPPVNAPTKQRLRVVWAVAAAGVLALGTGFTAWAMSAPQQTNQQQVPPTSQVVTPPAAPALTDPAVIGTTQPAPATAVLPTEIVPPVTPQPVRTAGPAVVSTLGDDDPGFGWPSSAFGTVNP